MVSVTPGNPTYAVYITSPEVGGYDFTSVNFGASTISTLAIVVMSTGTVSEYFALSVTADGGWTPVVADSAHRATTCSNCRDTSTATQPADATFSMTVQRHRDGRAARHRALGLLQPGVGTDRARVDAKPVDEAENAVVSHVGNAAPVNADHQRTSDLTQECRIRNTECGIRIRKKHELKENT